jgi:hypothetical protein
MVVCAFWDAVRLAFPDVDFLVFRGEMMRGSFVPEDADQDGCSKEDAKLPSSVV